MKIDILDKSQRGIMNTADFKGYHIFSNGAKGTKRPDSFGTVYVFNDDYLFPNAYLGMHPHANVEVITVMIDGRESHKDNLGYQQELETGAVQLISSGSGIQHAGGNMSDKKNARHLQIWIAPRVLNSAPSVQLLWSEPDSNLNEWTCKISPDGKDGSLIIKQDAWLYMGSFENGETTYNLQKTGNVIMLYIVKGKVQIGDSIANGEDTLFITDTKNIQMLVEETSTIVLIETVL